MIGIDSSFLDVVLLLLLLIFLLLLAQNMSLPFVLIKMSWRQEPLLDMPESGSRRRNI